VYICLPYLLIVHLHSVSSLPLSPTLNRDAFLCPAVHPKYLRHQLLFLSHSQRARGFHDYRQLWTASLAQSEPSKGTGMSRGCYSTQNFSPRRRRGTIIELRPHSPFIRYKGPASHPEISFPPFLRTHSGALRCRAFWSPDSLDAFRARNGFSAAVNTCY
jgi:hypothetical protein